MNNYISKDVQELINKTDLSDYKLHPVISFRKFFIITVTVAVIVYTGINLINSLWILPIILVLGYLLQYPYNVMHDCLHSTFAKSKKVNEYLGIFFGTIIFVNFSLFKAYHIAHHMDTHGPGDPEPFAGKINSLGRYLYELFTPLFFIDNFLRSGKILFGISTDYCNNNICTKKVRRDFLITLLWIGIVITLMQFFLYEVILLYLIPVYISYIFDFFFLLPEHYDVDDVRGVNFGNTRTITSSWLQSQFLCHINHHVEHHIFQNVPEYYAKDIHKKMKTKIKHLEKSYFIVHARLIKSFFTDSPGIIKGKSN